MPEQPNTPAAEEQIEYEYVDLGLSVYWATRNVGAEKPEDIGSYYSWGETVPKKEYTWSTYKYSKNDKGKKFSKYVYRKWNGNKDRMNTLDLSDDILLFDFDIK